MALKLGISNIAWDKENDLCVLSHLKELGYDAIEIAPTIPFPDRPYEHIREANIWAQKILLEYDLKVCSLQSIWYGRQEKMFGSIEERQSLLQYTKQAIEFAEAIGAGNLVFGCPKNRCVEKETDIQIAIDFFGELGDYANRHNTVLALEANPVIYGTNFINSTIEAIELIKKVDCKGFLLNFDLGTLIFNEEVLAELDENYTLINHVHISEPQLAQIKQRDIHRDLINGLLKHNYDKYVSIEMGKCGNLEELYKITEYVKRLNCEEI